MNKALNKSKTIKKAAEAYKNNPNLNFRRAAIFHDVTPNSIKNYPMAKLSLHLIILLPIKGFHQ